MTKKISFAIIGFRHSYAQQLAREAIFASNKYEMFWIDRKRLLFYYMGQLFYAIEHRREYVNTNWKKEDIGSLFEIPL